MLTPSWSITPCKKLLLSLCLENNANQNSFFIFFLFSQNNIHLPQLDSKQRERLKQLSFFTSVFFKSCLFPEQCVKFGSTKQTELLSGGDKILFFSLCYQIHLQSILQYRVEATYNFHGRKVALAPGTV